MAVQLRRSSVLLPWWAAMLLVTLVTSTVWGQPSRREPPNPARVEPREDTDEKIEELIDEELEAEATLRVNQTRSKLVRTKRPVLRFSVTNPDVVDIIQYSPTEFELIGGRPGTTTMTLWYPAADEADEPKIIRYLVLVGPDETDEYEYGRLEDEINELFPCSFIQIQPVADKLLVRGQAKDAAEASQILAIIGGRQVDQVGNSIGFGSFLNLGTAARPYLTEQDAPAASLINLLEVPGEQQIMLRVRIAELTRAAARTMGSNFAINDTDFNLSSGFGGTSSGGFSAILTTEELTLALSAQNGNSYSKILAEPNLVTLNGQPASFISGGEFAVPTVVGIDGVGAATTSFRGFGTQLSFIPTLIGKDRIRLSVTPSVSSPSGGSVGGIPSLSTKSVSTTVDLREGQWLAIGGLVQDQQEGSRTGPPLLDSIPGLNMFFSQKRVSRSEAELVIMVSPELVHPLDAEEAPLILPGMEVTEPTDFDFFIKGRYEGKPGYHHRSTVWPIYRDWVFQAKCEAMKEARRTAKYGSCEACYVYGDHGFSK